MYDASTDPGSSLEVLGSRFSLLLFCQGHIVFFGGQILSVLSYFVHVLLHIAEQNGFFGHCTTQAIVENITVIRCNYR